MVEAPAPYLTSLIENNKLSQLLLQSKGARPLQASSMLPSMYSVYLPPLTLLPSLETLDLTLLHKTLSVPGTLYPCHLPYLWTGVMNEE